MKKPLIVFFISFALQIQVLGEINFVSQKIELKNGKIFNLAVPENYEIIPAIERLRRVRFFAKAPDGRIFVSDLHDKSDNRKGKIYILEDWNERSGKFGRATVFLDNLRNPNSVAFHKDKYGGTWFYVAETHKLSRYRYKLNSAKPSGKPQLVARFPDNGRNYYYGGWHLTRTIAFSPKGKLYVSIGSSCNSCVEREKMRATVLEMEPNGGKARHFARGLRNAVGLKWLNNVLYATNMGIDHMGKDAPDDTFYRLRDNNNYGWSFCYQSNGKITYDPKYKLPNLPPPDCSGVPKSFSFFPAHSAPLGFDYFDERTSDGFLRNSFLVALHGATNRNDKRGYKIVIVKKDGTQEDFLTGFLNGSNIYGRPCDIMKLGADSFLLTDDYAGVVYLVRKKPTP